jgi:hypothetical protein
MQHDPVKRGVAKPELLAWRSRCLRVSENSDGKIVKNVSKPSGKLNVCMGGDDGRYGWFGVMGDRAPRRHRHLFARADFIRRFDNHAAFLRCVRIDLYV